MRLIIILFCLFTTHLCFSQMWKEPLDTLPFIDKYELIDPTTHAKSCLIKKYVVEYGDEVDEWEYKEYDTRGRITKSSVSEGDTTYYFYNEFDVCQEIVYPGKERTFNQRFHIYENNRLRSILMISDNDTFKTIYQYENNLLKSIEYQNGNRVNFAYDSQGRILRREVVVNGKIEKYFEYYHNAPNGFGYSDCFYGVATQKDGFICNRTSVIFDEHQRLYELKFEPEGERTIVSRFEYNSDSKIISTRSKLFDEKDENYEVKYFYNEHELLIRTEYYLGGVMYMYYNFEWEYR